MAKIYYTGDLHFGHFNAIKYDCRPWPDVETMAEGLSSAGTDARQESSDRG